MLLLIAVTTDIVADTVLNRLEPLLDTHGLIVMTTRVGVVRGEKF